MSYQHLISFYVNDIFSWKICKKIIVTGNNAAGTVRKSLDKNLPSFHISTVHQHIKGCFPVHHSLQIFVSSMGVAYDQNLHTSSSFIRRRAFPR